MLGDRDDLGGRELTASGCNWLVEMPVGEPREGLAQIRYNAPPAAATFERLGEERLRVEFAEPQFAIAPGQAVVFYDGEVVLGGGWIRS